MEKGICRVLVYNLRQAELYFGGCMLGTVCCVGWIGLLNQEGVGDMLSMVGGMQMFITALVLYIYGLTGWQNLYGMLISFSCKRSHVLCGNMVRDLLISAQSCIVYVVYERLFGNSAMFSLMAAVLLFSSGLGQLAGMAAMRWGKAVYHVCTFLMILPASIAINLYWSMNGWKLWGDIRQAAGVDIGKLSLIIAFVFFLAAYAVCCRSLKKRYAVR